MTRRPLFAVLCVITGFAIGAFGALVLFAQFIEWRSFGNWNPVSIRYALDYFEVQPPHFIASGFQKIFNWRRDGFLDLPLSIVLLCIGSFIVVVGICVPGKKR